MIGSGKRSVMALVLMFAAGTASADKLDELGKYIDDAWGHRDGNWELNDSAFKKLEPVECQTILADLAAAKTPDTATFNLPHDSRDLKEGQHTVAEARKACDAIAYRAKVRVFEADAVLALTLPDIEDAKSCVETYDAVIKAGVPPTEPIRKRQIWVKNHDEDFGGATMEEVGEKVCDAPLKAMEEEKAKREAPYRAVLKNDKLQAVLEGRGFVMPGGDDSMTPAKMAAARTWYQTMSAPSNEEQNCASGGERVFLKAWHFDANHKLLNVTSKEYCGHLPDSVFK